MKWNSWKPIAGLDSTKKSDDIFSSKLQFLHFYVWEQNSLIMEKTLQS